MKSIIDPGHKYELLCLDGEINQNLTFVKRHDTEHPERFPGNTESYPGTTLQSVIRCLCDRIDYLQNQIPDGRNPAIKRKLEECIWLLEDRAAERHNNDFDFRVEDMLQMQMCKHCGHVVCKEFV